MFALPDVDADRRWLSSTVVKVLAFRHGIVLFWGLEFPRRRFGLDAQGKRGDVEEKDRSSKSLPSRRAD